jgi:hypothetical protein
MPLTIKQYLKTRFPQLGTKQDMNGGDTVDALGDLYAEANTRRSIVIQPIFFDKKAQIYNDDETYTEDGRQYSKQIGTAVLDAYIVAAQVGKHDQEEDSTIADAISELLHLIYERHGSVGKVEATLRSAQNYVATELGVPVQI